MSFSITGAVDGVKKRLNAADFVEDKKFFTLYVRALQSIQSQGQDEIDSFFQVAGIHGLPYVEWPSGKPGGRGYCTHGVVLFPTWHRVYVSLYEQVVQAAALKAASQFTVEPEAWLQAAQDLRQPFWDWGSDLLPPSKIISDETVTITDYNGEDISVDNPILRYTLPVELVPGLGTTTFRDQNVESTLSNPNRAASVRLNTWTMLKGNQGKWNDFSNHGVGSSHTNSLESIHDGIHGTVGGWMGVIPFAAFDPIFWLHHTNVDRCLSLWSALNPGTWVTQGVNLDPTLGITTANLDKDTPLAPFEKAIRDPWTSAMTSDTHQLGYTYPEFDSIQDQDETAKKNAIEVIIDELYGLRASRNKSNRALDELALFKGSPTRHVKKREVKIWDWDIYVTFKKYELKKSFSLDFYFSNADGGYESNFVGSVYAFRGTTPGDCANCKDNVDLIQEAYVDLSLPIAEDDGIKDFEPEDVIPFLKEKKLCYRFVTEEENATLTTLKIKLIARQLTMPAGTLEYVEGEVKEYDDIILPA